MDKIEIYPHSEGMAIGSYLFEGLEAGTDTLVVEDWHKPGSLTQSSGAWIHATGSVVLEEGTYAIKPQEQWVWFAVEDGEATLCRGLSCS